MTIHIESLHIDTIIGLLDFERVTPQRVTVDLEATYKYINGQYVDYVKLTELIEEELKKREYRLLEEALEGLEMLITTTYPIIDRLKLKILKPNILDNCLVGMSSEWSKDR
jgi:dihydroneopterin aldolase